jgi:hypothetical protein
LLQPYAFSRVQRQALWIQLGTAERRAHVEVVSVELCESSLRRRGVRGVAQLENGWRCGPTVVLDKGGVVCCIGSVEGK